MKKVYKGRCAKCGAGKNTSKMLARPGSLPLPDDVSEVLKYVSQTNCRLCILCYNTLIRAAAATPRALEIASVGSSTVQKSTPPVRV